jgi:hypothetical protein
LLTTKVFERITEGEAAGAAAGLVLGFTSGGLYIAIESGLSLNDVAHVEELQTAQPDKATLAARPQQFDSGETVGILVGPALLGAVVGATVVSGVRRVARRRVQQKLRETSEKAVERAKLQVQELNQMYALKSFEPRNNTE